MTYIRKATAADTTELDEIREPYYRQAQMALEDPVGVTWYVAERSRAIIAVCGVVEDAMRSTFVLHDFLGRKGGLDGLKALWDWLRLYAKEKGFQLAFWTRADNKNLKYWARHGCKPEAVLFSWSAY